MQLRFSDSAGNRLKGEISPGSYGFYVAGEGTVSSIPGLTPTSADSSWHTLRFTMNGLGAGGLTTYLDNNPVPESVVWLGSTGVANELTFGDATGANDADWDIDYMRWTNQGAFAPGDDPVCPPNYDYDDNGIVNLFDFSYLANLWFSFSQPPVDDINGDNIIGMEEIVDFFLHWLEIGERSTTYITDLNQSLPLSALSTSLEQDKWQLIPYHTAGLEGTMVGAPSYVNAPDLTIPHNLIGWYAICVGYWNFEFHLDGDSLIKFKLSDEAAFRQINEPQAPGDQKATYLHEAFVDYADVTGQNFVLGKSNGLLGKKAYLAYIKLVPLSEQEVQQIQQDRSDTSTRKLIATIDGSSFFGNSEYQSPQDFLELVELYRNSDVSKVLWGTSSGYRTNYQSSIVGSSWIGRDHSNISLIRDEDLNVGLMDDKQRYESLRALQTGGTLPQDIIASHVHSMGLDFDLMFGMGINGSFPGFPGWDPNSILALHPEYSQVTRSGQIVQKASFAFSPVRQFLINLIEEAATDFDTDGVNLNFVHGPRFIQYEQPFLDRFQQTYGVDAQTVSPTDFRLQIIRAIFMTEFVQDVRNTLDLVGVQKGKNLTLSVAVWPSQENLSPGGTPDWEGLDVADWIFSGYIDAVICKGAVDTNYLSWCNSQGLDYIYSKQAMTVVDVNQAYSVGVNNFAYWDIDSKQMDPESWPWIRRIGHQSDMTGWDNSPFEININRLISVDGVDVVDEGLEGTVYSGG